MARETVAQRNARYEAERLQRLAVAEASYPARLMALLERAVKENFELTVKNMEFRVEDRDARRSDAYLLTYAYSQEADNTLQSLEWAVEEKEAARAEYERVANLRKSALAKLTDEERAALSL